MLKIGIPSNLCCRPLGEVFEKRPGVAVEVCPWHQVATMLRQSEIGAGVVSPIEYARESSLYRILPGFAITSRAGVTLCMRKGLRDIKTIAANPAFASEIVLAKIVLTEEFELNPAIVPTMGSAEHMLTRADAALVAGDALMEENAANEGELDLVELWSEMVGLPYVHGFFAAREGTLRQEDVLQFREAALQTEIRRNTVNPGSGETQGFEDRYRSQFSYVLDDEAGEALQEFLKYAHYHGILPDIPSIRTYQSSDADDESLEDE